MDEQGEEDRMNKELQKALKSGKGIFANVRKDKDEDEKKKLRLGGGKHAFIQADGKQHLVPKKGFSKKRLKKMGVRK